MFELKVQWRSAIGSKPSYGTKIFKFPGRSIDEGEAEFSKLRRYLDDCYGLIEDCKEHQ